MEISSQLVLASARTFGFMVSMPFGDAVSTLPRLLLSVILGAATTAQVADSSEASLLFVVGELAVGYVLGYPFRFVIDLADLLGELLDAARGQTVASIVDPLNGPSASDLAAILRLAGCALALHSGALTSGCHALQVSYSVIPISTFASLDLLSARVLSSSFALVGSLASTFVIFVGSFIVIDGVAALCAKVCNGLSFSTVAHLGKLIACAVLALISAYVWGNEVLTYFADAMLDVEPL